MHLPLDCAGYPIRRTRYPDASQRDLGTDAGQEHSRSIEQLSSVNFGEAGVAGVVYRADFDNL
jgi:hypothetical protein